MRVLRGTATAMLALAVLLVAVPTAGAAVEQAAAIDVAATAGTPFSGPVASFRSTTPDLAQFTATVGWGDGSAASAGTVSTVAADPNTELTTFRVDAAHTYPAAGTFTTAVELTQAGLTDPPVVEALARQRSDATACRSRPRPFVELKEAIGGYCFLDADDLDAAIELAARIPAARMGGTVEVRPIVER